MNKKLLFAIIGIVIVAAIVGIVLFVMKGNGGSNTIEFTYKTNGGVPYEWKYEIENKDIVEFVKQYEVDNQNGDDMVGAPISNNYVFKGLKKGTTTITFKYVNIVDGSVDKEEKLNVKVDGRRNISLVGTNK